MDRRSALRSIAALAVPAAGCLGLDDGTDNSSSINGTGPADGAGQSGAAAGALPPSGNCDSAFSTAERTYCGGNGAPAVLHVRAAPLELERSAETVDTLEFGLRTGTESQLDLDPTRFRIIDSADGSAVEDPTVVGGTDTRTLSAGDTHEWSLTATRHPTPAPTPERTYIMADLDAGEYVFAVMAELRGVSIEFVASFAVVDGAAG